MLDLIFKGQENLLVLISAFIIGGIIRHHNLVQAWLYRVSSFQGDKRFSVMLISLFAGVLPVEGRVSISAPILDSVVSNEPCCAHSRKKMGILDFVANHHYYLWSPLESTTIIVMAGLSLSYYQLLSYTLLPLVVYLAYLGWVVYKYVDPTDIQLVEPDDIKTKHLIGIVPFFLGLAASIYWNPVTVFPCVALLYYVLWPVALKELGSFIRIKPLLFVAFVIVVANIVKANHAQITAFLTPASTSSTLTFVLALSGAFVASLALGSSGKYAGIAVALTLVFGIKYLPLILMIEYAGYLLSPTHKCLAISASYFSTSASAFYKRIAALSGLMVVTGLIQTLVL